MNKTQATIRKVGSQFCVFSKDGSRKFGCFDSREAAEKRLGEIEHFKKTKSMNDYNDAFTNMAKALKLGEKSHPEDIGQAPDSRPRQIDVGKSLGLNGTIAGRKSDRILDQREHFPVTTEVQAHSSMVRAMRMREVPHWYNGTLENMREEVWVGVLTKHPVLAQKLKVPVNVEHALALSDGEENAETSKRDIKDPAHVRKNDVGVDRPNISSAARILAQHAETQEGRVALAGQLMEMINKKEAAIKEAKKIASRLLKSGLKADEFETLSTFLQEDILRELLMNGVKAAPIADPIERRRELLDRMTKND